MNSVKHVHKTLKSLSLALVRLLINNMDTCDSATRNQGGVIRETFACEEPWVDQPFVEKVFSWESHVTVAFPEIGVRKQFKNTC